jgi:dihydrofolate reductase
MISLIAAMNRRRAIGKENALLWHLPRDMRWFRETTTGKPVIMGRSTFESIGRPLPRRTNVVLTRRVDFSASGCIVAATLDDALAAAGEVPEIMVIGGAQVYLQFLPRADRVYLTHVDNDLEGDAWFPELDPSWRAVSATSMVSDDENRYGCTFAVYERVTVASPPEIVLSPAAR